MKRLLAVALVALSVGACTGSPLAPDATTIAGPINLYIDVVNTGTNARGELMIRPEIWGNPYRDAVVQPPQGDTIESIMIREYSWGEVIKYQASWNNGVVSAEKRADSALSSFRPFAIKGRQVSFEVNVITQHGVAVTSPRTEIRITLKNAQVSPRDKCQVENQRVVCNF